MYLIIFIKDCETKFTYVKELRDVLDLVLKVNDKSEDNWIQFIFNPQGVMMYAEPHIKQVK